MNLFSLALSRDAMAPVGPTFDVKDVQCTATQAGVVKMDFKPIDDDFSIFFESPIAAIDKCRIDVKNGIGLVAEPINFIGMLSDRGEGVKTDLLKMKICSKNGGEIPVADPQLAINRNFEQQQASCKSTGDPHISTFTNVQYNNYAEGAAWLVKSDLFDVQVLHEKCYGGPTCNTKVGIRYLDNVYVADLATTQYNCHSSNKCAASHGTTIQVTPNGGSIVTLPGNIVINTNKNFALGLDVVVNAPGQDVSKYAPSICNPDYEHVADVTVPEYVVADSQSYFAPNEVTVAMPKSAPAPGFNECQLPVSCDVIYTPPKPVTPIVDLAPVETQKATAPVETQKATAPVETEETRPKNSYGQETGKKVHTGFKIHVPVKYVAPPKDAVLLPSKAQNALVKPSLEEAEKNCNMICDAHDFLTVGNKADLQYIIKGCIADYAFTMVNGISLALEAARKQCLTQLQKKTEDVIKTSSDLEKAKECQVIQAKHQLGDKACKCGANGTCTAFGCECKPGYGGAFCKTLNPLPKAVKPTVAKMEASKPIENAYKLPESAPIKSKPANIIATASDSTPYVPIAPLNEEQSKPKPSKPVPSKPVSSKSEPSKSEPSKSEASESEASKLPANSAKSESSAVPEKSVAHDKSQVSYASVLEAPTDLMYSGSSVLSGILVIMITNFVQ